MGTYIDAARALGVHKNIPWVLCQKLRYPHEPIPLPNLRTAGRLRAAQGNAPGATYVPRAGSPRGRGGPGCPRDGRGGGSRRREEPLPFPTAPTRAGYPHGRPCPPASQRDGEMRTVRGAPCWSVGPRRPHSKKICLKISLFYIYKHIYYINILYFN